MILFILAILLLVGSIVGAIFMLRAYKKSNDKELDKPFLYGGRALAIAGPILGIALLISSFMTAVPTGHTGVLTTFGKVEDQTFEAGLNFKLPWQSVVKMDNRVQIAEYELSCFSSDIQEVSVSYRVNFQIDKKNAQQIYRTVGRDYAKTILEPRVQEAVKAIVAKYTAEQLIGTREALSTAIEEILVADAANYNIQVVATAISNIDFTDAFTNAVEAKQVAAQNKLKAETEQAQKTMEAKQTAERAKIQALADAEVAKTKANADAEVAMIAAEADLAVQKINADAAEYVGQKEAAKNKVLSENLNEALLRYYEIQQWNGTVPAVQSSDGSNLYLNVDGLLTK